MQSHYKVGCDAHKRYSVFAVRGPHGDLVEERRVNHERGAIQAFLSQFPEGTAVALESVGNWYCLHLWRRHRWIVDEIEAAGCLPKMAHPAKAKVMMGNVHKTDKLDAAGLATLEHLGSLPTVWIAPREIRDERELPRTRMAFAKLRAAIKNRVHSTLAKYALSLEAASDLFAPKWRGQLQRLVRQLPEETRRCVGQELELLDTVQVQIGRLEERIRERTQPTASMRLLKSLPGVGDILAIVIDRELGTIHRFSSNVHFASYSGVVPRVSSSGGKYRYGRMVKQANNYLKWAFIEAANAVVRQRHHPRWQQKHVSVLYERTRRRKGDAVAVGAVARHLAEATFWVLTKGESYQEPREVLPKQGQARG